MKISLVLPMVPSGSLTAAVPADRSTRRGRGAWMLRGATLLQALAWSGVSAGWAAAAVATMAILLPRWVAPLPAGRRGLALLVLLQGLAAVLGFAVLQAGAGALGSLLLLLYAPMVVPLATLLRARLAPDRPVSSVPAPSPIPRGARLPRISFHLLIRDASGPEVRSTLNWLATLPSSSCEVLVVDSSGSPAAWEPVAEHCARLRHCRFFHLGPVDAAQSRAFARTETHPDAEWIGFIRPGAAGGAEWWPQAVARLAEPDCGVLHTIERRHPDLPRLQELEAAGALPWLEGLSLVRRDALDMAAGAAASDDEAALRPLLFRQGWRALLLTQDCHRPQPCRTTLRREARRLATLWRRHGDALSDVSDPAFTPEQRRQLLGEASAVLLQGWAWVVGLSLPLGLIVAPSGWRPEEALVALAILGGLAAAGRPTVCLAQAPWRDDPATRR